jgi:uroporphyrinogen-III synthase
MAPTVLLTRPQLVATDTLLALEAKGCRVILAPMLDIRPLAMEEVAKPFDLLFVTSKWCFLFSHSKRNSSICPVHAIALGRVRLLVLENLAFKT